MPRRASVLRLWFDDPRWSMRIGLRAIEGRTITMTQANEISCGTRLAAPSKRVLMISYGFPPTGGPGVQRSAKFAKYLPVFGWTPVVWATNCVDHMPVDETLLDGLPAELAVHRFHGVRRGGVRRALGDSARKGGLLSGIAKRIDWRWSRWQADGAFPDEAVGWAKASVSPLRQLAQREGIDAIYSTFSPISNHWLAMTLKHELGLPWVADFRDLWTDDYRYNQSSPARRHADSMLYTEILRSADAVIGVTDRQTEILASHVPGSASKFVSITNGYDPDDFEASVDTRVATETDRDFVLAHVGRLDRWRTGQPLYDGLRQFLAAGNSSRPSLRCRVVGHVGPEVGEKLRATGADCSFTGYVDHRQAIEEMRKADVLLLCVPPGPNGDSVIPGKLFEYLASQRPILVVGPQGGECERIVRQSGAGLAVGFDADAIAEALQSLYKAWLNKEDRFLCDPTQLKPYARPHLTSKLAAVLNQILSDSYAPGNAGGRELPMEVSAS